MNINIDQLKSAALSGDPDAMSKLASMHISGMFPGANPREGIMLLERLSNPPYERHSEMLELGLHYVKGEHVTGKKDKGLELIEKGLVGLGDNVPFEHCFEVGMLLTTITDKHGEKILKWQRLSAKLLEQTLADAQGMANLDAHMGQQAVMMVRGMLHAVKGWISNYEPYVDALDHIRQSSIRTC